MASDKEVRKLFQNAEADQKVRGMSRKRGNKKLGVKIESTDTQFCDGCFAVREGGVCPNCSAGKKDYSKYCKRCMHVHLHSIKNCEAWQPRTE